MRKSLSIFFITLLIKVIGQVPASDIYLTQLDLSAPDTSNYGIFENITQRKGYDNQPSFNKKGNGFYYSRIEDSLSDIYFYDLVQRESRQISRSLGEAEYSPRYNTYTKTINCVRVESNGKVQNLYEYDLYGEPRRKIIGDEDTIGYYCQLEKDLWALFMLEGAKHSLYYFNSVDSQLAFYTHSIGRCMSRHLDYFVYVDKSDSQYNTVKYVDVADPRQTARTLCRLPGNTEDFVFVDKDKLLCAHKSSLYIYDLRESRWILWQKFDSGRITNIRRLAYDKKHGQLLFCADDPQ